MGLRLTRLAAHRGQGAVMCWQVDVSNRTGEDPVSTRLAANLLGWLLDEGGAPPAPALADLAREHPPAARFEGYVGAPPPVPGVHAGDLFWREKLVVPAFEE